ncbi:MAG: hypothetical protein LUC98_04270, partial [Lachnospiraceae bacterium]|nr:hypothetical protein [Lachnospiraceae bacterium]
MKRVKKLLAFLLAFALVFGSLQSGVMTVAAETGSEAAEAADDGQASDDTPSTEEEVAEEENEEEEPADDTAEEDAASDEQASLKAAADEPAAAEEAVAEASASDPEATDESVEDAEEDESIEPDAETEDAQPEESDEAEEEAEPAEDDSSETEEPQDEEKEDAEETEEESDDLFVLETTQGDVTVRISGTADTLAGVVSVSVTELNDERIVAYEEAFAEDDSITVSEVIAAYDITLLDADGKAVEPNGSVSVSITSKTLQEYLEEGEDIQVIHDTNTTVEAVEDDSIDSETVSVDALEVMDVESDDSGEVNFTADSFSTYVITVSSASVFPSDGVLADDTTYELSSNITLAKDLTVPAGATVTIDLKGFTLTGTGTSPVITVNGNLTIQDTSSGTTSGYIDADTGLWMAGTSEDEDDITQNLTGGVITGGKTGTVVQYSDDNNEPLGSGIYVDGGNLTLVSGNIAGNDFSNATTDLKDGYRISNGGGVAVCNEGTFTMSGGNVVGNVARIAGGVWCGPDCTFNLDGGNVSYNTALYGGGVEAWGSNAEIIVDGGDITYNSAENGLGGGMGGGAYIQNNGQLTLKSGSISNNTAEYRGGAIIGNANGATISIQGGTVDHNKITCAGSHNVYAGAAIYLAGTSSETYASLIMTGGSISNNVFADTTAERNGGAIYAGGYAKIELSGTAYISENSAKLGGAIYCYENASVSLSGSASITGNNVTSQGGAIYCRNYASVSLSGNASITGNSAGTSGGAIYLKENANLEISDSAVISANSAVTSGGGIAMDDSTLTMTGGSVKNNNTSSTASGSGKGGAIYASSDATVKLSGTAAISGNSARLGAGIYLDGSSAELEIAGNVEISGNTSNLGGGGIYLYKSTLTMTGGSITGNKTGSNGGGVYVFDSDTKMSVSGNPVITGNTMSSDDSANNVYLPSSTYITLADDGLTSGAEIGVTVASNTNTDTYSSNNTPTGRQVTTAEAETTSYYASAYRYIVPDVSSFTSGTTYTVLSQVDADDSKNYVEFVLTSDETYTVTLNL